MSNRDIIIFPYIRINIGLIVQSLVNYDAHINYNYPFPLHYL